MKNVNQLTSKLTTICSLLALSYLFSGCVTSENDGNSDSKLPDEDTGGEMLDASRDGEKPVGELGGPCYPNNTCNEGLVCAHKRCIKENVPDAGGQKICEPYEKWCRENLVMMCDKEGKGYALLENCRNGTICVEGECVPDNNDGGGLEDGGVESDSGDVGTADSGDTDVVEEDSGEDSGDDDDDTPDCENECEILDSAKCLDGSSYSVCVEKNGCLIWSAQMDCKSGEVCRGAGICGFDECPEDMKRCNGPEVEKCMDENGDGFTKWIYQQTCSGKCENGVCVGCSKNHECRLPTPFCDTSSNTCVQCLADKDCPNLTYCEPSSKSCVCKHERCGGVCCEASEKCDTNGVCCAPNCVDKCDRWHDGCGGYCTDPCPKGKICKSKICEPCGAENQFCCAEGVCDHALYCVSDVCKLDCAEACVGKCGGVPDGCGGYCNAPCETGKICQNGTCVPCGGINQPCCSGNQCNSGLACQSDICKTPPQDVWYDANNNLTWKKFVPPDKMSQQQAIDYCKGLGTDWRLPSISDLRSLVRGCAGTQKGGSCCVTDSCLYSASCSSATGCGGCLNSIYGVGCWVSSCNGCALNSGPSNGCYWDVNINGECSTYWSSSANASSSKNGWGIDYSKAQLINWDKTLQNYVHCVKTGQ